MKSPPTEIGETRGQWVYLYRAVDKAVLGFKRFDHAVVTISGIELAEKIKKGQFKTSKLGGCHATMTVLGTRHSQLEPPIAILKRLPAESR